MKRRLPRAAFLAALLLAIVVAALPLRPAHAQEDPPADSDIAVVVLPFEINADPRYDYLNASLPELVSESLEEEGFRVISQERVRSLIQQQNVTFLDLDTAKRLAEAAGARFAVYGSFSQIGEAVSLDARLVDAQGEKRALPLYVSQSGMANLGLAVGELSQKLSEQLYAEDAIAEIEVRGLQYLDEDVVLQRLSIREGDPFNPRAMNEEIKRIFDLGYFDDVRVSVADAPDGKRVVFDLEEKPRIRAVGVVGNDAFDDDEITEVMSTKSGSVLNPKLLSDDLEKIRELYRGEGYFLAEISHEVEEVEPGAARLNIVVKETQRLYVTEIKLEGVESLSEGDVRDELALSERSIISFITGSGVLKEELLEHDAAAIEEFYANHGFIDVQVSPAQVDYTEDGIHVTYTVVEGPRYKVGAIEFAGDMLVPADDLRKVTQLDDLAEDDDWFSRETLREDAENLTTFYNNFGYAFAETDVQFAESDEEGRLDVAFTFTKNQKVHIRRVVIEGNTKTRDNVIRREIALADGDQFHGDALRVSNARLERLDYFESYEIETVPTDDPKELDLKVNVKEKSTGLISGGLGYGSYGGVFLSAKIEEKNLFGRGYFLGFSGSFSGTQSLFNLSFTNPRLYDSLLSVGFDAYFTEEEFPEFEKESAGGGVRFGYPVGRYSRVSAGYSLEKYRITDVSIFSSQDLLNEVGDHWASVVTLGFVRDTTNRGQNPTRGWQNSLDVTLAGGFLGGDDDYIKVVTDHNYYYLLPWGNEHIFHWHAQAGLLTENAGGGDVPVFPRFYLGGMNSIRGYEGMHIAPRDPVTGELIGGTRQFFTNLEYLFRISEEFGLQGVFFYDAGDAWGGGDSPDLEIKQSLGGGIRWFSPFGLLRVEYGYALNEISRQGERHRVEFSMGSSF